MAVKRIIEKTLSAQHWQLECIILPVNNTYGNNNQKA
jgi:hypothetical protein